MREIARLRRTVFLEYDLVYALESMHGGVQNPLRNENSEKERNTKVKKKNANPRDVKKG